MMKPPKSSAKVVWTYGAITGVCLSILWFVALFRGSLGFIPSILLAIVPTMVAFLLVGMLASKQTGRVRTGTLAGLVATFIGGSLIGGSLMWEILPLMLALRRDGLLTVHELFDAFLSLAFAVECMLGVGTGLGALGGLIGKRKAKVLPASDPMYSPYPQQQEPQQYPQQQQ